MNMKYGIFAALVLFVGTAVMAQEPTKKKAIVKKETKKEIPRKKISQIKTN